MFVISSNFIGEFKLGDNINYNLRTLTLLYQQYSITNLPDKRFLIKPIVIINTSIIEAVLCDFLEIKIKTFTIEGVCGISQEILNYLRSKKIDKFELYITQSKKHNFFDLNSLVFYDKLQDLRKIRNRIHIQNTKKHLPLDEYDVFTEQVKELSEKVLEKVMKTMNKKYSRGSSQYVQEFKLPWDEYFPS